MGHANVRLLGNDKETAYALQKAAREQFKLKMLADIAADMSICQIEGWDHREYVLELHQELERIIGKLK